MELFYKICIAIDAVIYNFVEISYRIFLLLAQGNIFSISDFQNLLNRTYIIMSVIMLFMLSYSLLKALVNPDDLTKGDKSIAKQMMNLVISIVAIVLLPTIFGFADQLSSVILNSGVIGRVITGSEANANSADADTIKSGGKIMANTVFSAFFQPKDSYCLGESLSADEYTSDWYLECSNTLKSDEKFKLSTSTGAKPISLAEAYSEANTTGRFAAYRAFAKNVDGDEIEYTWLISGLAGIFLVYVIVSFCFDLGIRAVKLGVLEMFAPIPLLARVIPGKGDEIFKNWLKKILAVYFEVFSRVIIMYLGVYVIVLFINSEWLSSVKGMSGSAGGFIVVMAEAFIIMGIVAFIKQAPGLLKDITGIDSGNMKLGIKDKFAAGGGGAFALAGKGIQTFAKNYNRFRDPKTGKIKDGKRWDAIKSGLGGFGSTVGRGAKGAFTSNTWNDATQSANKAQQGAIEARDKRNVDKEKYGDGVIERYRAKSKENREAWLGLEPNIDELRSSISYYERLTNPGSFAKSTYGGEIERLDQEITKTKGEYSSLINDRIYDAYSKAENSADKEAIITSSITTRTSEIQSLFENGTPEQRKGLNDKVTTKMSQEGLSLDDARAKVAYEQARFEFKTAASKIESLKSSQDAVKSDKIQKNATSFAENVHQLAIDLNLNPSFRASLGTDFEANGVFGKILGMSTSDLQTLLKGTDPDDEKLRLNVAKMLKTVSDNANDQKAADQAKIARVKED